ncbi:MAG: hypothetical protein O6951_03185 [Actinobacteria bacterium]|nr:hypothetical protein [Actinomycetota bacterium]
MFLDAEIWQSLAIIGGVGAVGGLVGGFVARADNLLGTILMGIIGGIALATVFRIAGWPAVYAVGEDFSVVWGGVGGLILGYVVGHSNV